MSVVGPLLGIDYGRRRLGLAVSDGLGLTTSELGFIARESDQQAARVVAALVAEQEAVAVVIGLPLHAAGQAGHNVAWVRTFVGILQPLLSVPVSEVDERYSSYEAEQELRAANDWPVPPGRVDARAACILLRRYLAGER